MPTPHLYLHTPEPVFKARVNLASATYPVAEIPFDGVTLGTSSVIEFGMTLLLGTSDGADDLGRQRIRDSVVGSKIQIPNTSQGIEDGQLDVQDDAYITVLLDFRLWAKLPTFDVENAQDRKDGWIAVGNKLTTEIPPVANTGAGFADYINTGTGVITVTFPESSINTSFAVGDGETIDAHTWDVRDGTITVGTASDDVITATFPAGFRYVVHTVESSSGATHTARVPVLAIDPADDPTLSKFQVNQRLEQWGQTLDITLFQDAPRSTYPDGTLVMFWLDAPEDSGDRSHMKFIGWIDNENSGVKRNQRGVVRETTLHCVDIAGRLRQLPGFPQALSRVEEESPWSYYPSLDMGKSLHYLLHWHCTALDIADFVMPDLSDYNAMRLDAGGASLWEQVSQQAGKLVPDHLLTCNARGKLEVRRDWRLDDEGDRPASAPVLTEDEWTDLTFDYNRHPKIHVLRSAAILASTAFVDDDGVDTLPLAFSIAPSNASAFGQGLSEHTENEGLALSQEELNIAEGHRYAALNSRFGEFSFTDPTGYNFWDYEPAEMRRVQLNIGAAYAAQRGLAFTSASGMVKSVQVTYATSQRGTSIKAAVTWEKEVSGFPAITFEPEETEPVEYVPPEVTIPLPGDESVYYGEMAAYVFWDAAHVARTWNLQAATPTWEGISGTISGTIYDAQYFHVDVDTIGVWLLSSTGVWLCLDIMAATPSWDNVLPIATVIAGDAVPATGTVEVRCMAHYWLQPGHLCVASSPVDGDTSYLHAYFWVTTDFGATWTHVDMNAYTYTSDSLTRCYAYAGRNGMAAFRSSPTIYCVRTTARTGISNGRTSVFVSEDMGLTWTMRYEFGNWSANQNLASILHPFPNQDSASYIARSIASTGSPQLWLSTDEWVTATQITTEPAGHSPNFGKSNVIVRVNKRTFEEGHIITPMLIDSSSNADLYESYDYGATWTLLENLNNSTDTPNGWPPDVDQWVLIDSTDEPRIWLTLDNFATLLDKTGNLETALGGTFSNDLNNGFALPRVGVNA